MPQPPAAPPLVCHIILRLDYGGLENGLVNLINLMPEDAYRHAVLCLSHATDFRHRIRRAGVPVLQAHKAPGKDVGAYLRVWRMLRRLRPAIVHTRNLPAVDMLAVARAAGVRRLVHSEHGLDMFELDGRNVKYNRLRRATKPIVGRYIALSADLRDWLAGEIRVPPDRLSLIYNGVDTAKFRPRAPAEPRALPDGFAPPDAVVIGTIGRLEAVKDQVTLAQAFARLVQARPELRRRLRLVMIGEGSLRPEIERVLGQAGAAELAWLPGFRDDTAELYRSLDLFVLPSRREGISNTILEAMASGLPVLATRVGGNPEIVADGETGLLVPAADPAAMAEALAGYAADPERLSSHGAAGRKQALERFSLAAMVAGYRGVYDSLT
jgi:sugar transferase (PEP-CTERM/EpsH1 system associated)